MTMSSISTEPTVEDDHYDHFLSLVRDSYARAASESGYVFTTDAQNLMEVYLDAAPFGTRQHRNCHACRQFLERFGGLVNIDRAGNTHSLFWAIDDAPPMYRDAVEALRKAVERATVTGVFVSSDRKWGTPVTGKWTHIAVEQIRERVWTSKVQTAGQRMAERLEERGMLLRGLADFDEELVRHACALLENGSLYRSEKCLGVARWLLELHERRNAERNKRARENITWHAVAGAPPGFCHVRSGMIGSLLEDLAAKLPFETVKRRFDEKMDPLRYQRPVAPLSAGNIAQAEKIVGALESAGALRRRYAKLSDIKALWMPTPPKAEEKKGGVFGHLLGGDKSKPIDTGARATVMTWTKFASTVLPSAESIELLVPSTRSSFTAYVTAADPGAPPILQWDREDLRNAVSWYVYNGGSYAHQWGLRSGAYCPVTAVSLSPAMWDPERQYSNHTQGVCFILQGAKDTREAGLALFPETLKSEYHAVRRTIEEYSNRGKIEGREEAEACGILLQKGRNWDETFRVTSRGVVTTYRLDRWD